MGDNQQPGVQIGLDQPVDAALVQRNVLLCGDRHEAVRSEGAGIDAWEQFPFLPAVVVLGGGETEGVERLGSGKSIVAPLPGKKSGKKSVISLAYDDDGIVLLKDQELALYCFFGFWVSPIIHSEAGCYQPNGAAG